MWNSLALETRYELLKLSRLPIFAFMTVGMQLFWLAVTCLIGRVILSAGRQKLVVQGG